MELGMVGLGKMGHNMTLRLVRGGLRVVASDLSADAVAAVAKEGAIGASSLANLVAALAPPRAVWLMVPSGPPTQAVIDQLSPLLTSGDVIIDGGNSYYRDSLARGQALAAKGIAFVDCGTSGGIWGLNEGFCLMLGGPSDVIDRLAPIFATLAPSADRGWARVGPSGAGHFVKMVHNGIEYGLMQAYAEGFSVLKHKTGFALDLPQVAELWRHGSVVRSWLLDLAARALDPDPTLSAVQPWVADSGEGRWTALEALDLDVPAPVMTLALIERLRSRDAESFGDRLVAALRQEFGGHAVKNAPPNLAAPPSFRDADPGTAPVLSDPATSNA